MDGDSCDEGNDGKVFRLERFSRSDEVKGQGMMAEVYISAV